MPLLFWGCSSGVYQELPGQFAPFIRIIGLSGEEEVLPDQRFGRTALLFWSRTCSRSRSLVEDFNEIARDGRQGTRYIAVNIDEADDYDKVRDYVSSNELNNVDHAFSGNGVYDEAYMTLRGEYVPYLVVLDRDGEILGASLSLDPIE